MRSFKVTNQVTSITVTQRLYSGKSPPLEVSSSPFPKLSSCLKSPDSKRKNFWDPTVHHWHFLLVKWKQWVAPKECSGDIKYWTSPRRGGGAVHFTWQPASQDPSFNYLSTLLKTVFWCFLQELFIETLVCLSPHPMGFSRMFSGRVVLTRHHQDAKKSVQNTRIGEEELEGLSLMEKRKELIPEPWECAQHCCERSVRSPR